MSGVAPASVSPINRIKIVFILQNFKLFKFFTLQYTATPSLTVVHRSNWTDCQQCPRFRRDQSLTGLRESAGIPFQQETPPTLDPSHLKIYYAARAPDVLRCGKFGVVCPAKLDYVCHVALRHPRARPFLSSSTPVSLQSTRDDVSRYVRFSKHQFHHKVCRYASLRTGLKVVRFYGFAGKDMFVIERLFDDVLTNVIRPLYDANRHVLLRPCCVLRIPFMLEHAVSNIH